MERNKKIAVAGGVVAAAALALGGIGVASATLGDDDTPITGPALDEATAAALDHVGEGEVTETEVGDEDGAYEVEITLDDGSQVDVHLDDSFAVIGTEADDEDGSDDGPEDNDTD